MKTIYWFRKDLRIEDNPALFNAVQNSNTVLPVYIYDTKNPNIYEMGNSSKHWLHYSLQSLKKSIHSNLSIYMGNPIYILINLIKKHDVKKIYWNRCYEPWEIDRDKQIKEDLNVIECSVESFNGSLLWEPWKVSKSDGTPYKVFTPFYKNGCLSATPPRVPLEKPELTCLETDDSSLEINDLNLISSGSFIKLKFQELWRPGEQNANIVLKNFISEGLYNYKEGRNIPSKQQFVSKLSPHIHFGEISVNNIWYKMSKMAGNSNIDNFCSELGWREFAYSMLFYNRDLPNSNLHKKFDNFPWENNLELLEAWKYGNTGIPMVDAGMRELLQTGYMHNRTRMIVGSFLVKNLLIHWSYGERWFWEHLVDADLASNSASWQWVAGCGADAAPFFRIFNPVTQGKKFDPDGVYIRKYLPELNLLDNKYLFSPWEASSEILHKYNITLGTTYPKPIVDLKLSREAALKAYKEIK